MNMKIVVIGGTGLIGSKLVEKLKARDYDAVAAGLETGLNTLTGQGLAEVLQNASVLVDVSNSPSFEEKAVMEFFQTSTRNLLSHASKAGVKHYVALSVVGTERMEESPYIRAKMAREKLIRESSIPSKIADSATTNNEVHLPAVFIQPMAGEDVAKAVGRVAVGAPVSGIVEVGGPERFELPDFVRESLRARNDMRPVIADPNARYFGARLGELTLVPGESARLGEVRFQDWLQPAAARS